MKTAHNTLKLDPLIDVVMFQGHFESVLFCHQMILQTYYNSTLPALCEGNSPVIVNSPHNKEHVVQSLVAPFTNMV